MTAPLPPDDPTTTHRPLPTRARAAVVVAFAVQGLCFASLVTRIPALQDRFGLSTGQLTALLAVVPVIAGVGSVLAGTVASKVGSAPVLRVIGPAVPVGLIVVGWTSSFALLIAGLLLLGLGLGGTDASMNMQGIAVQDRYGRSLVASYYAVFSLAGIAGALVASVAAGAGVGLGPQFTAIALVCLPVQLFVGRWLLHGRPLAVTELVEEVERELHIDWRPVLLVGIVLMCVYIADSGASNWSAEYVNKTLGGAEAVASLAYAFYAFATMVGRTVADRYVATVGAVRLVRVGGIVAVVAATAVALAPSSPLALVGFTVLGLGICPAIPLAFTAAASHDRAGTGVAVARVNVFNYVGFVLGAPVIGIVADATGSLRWGFAALVPVLVVVPLLARWFEPARHVAAG